MNFLIADCNLVPEDPLGGVLPIDKQIPTELQAVEQVQIPCSRRQIE